MRPIRSIGLAVTALLVLSACQAYNLAESGKSIELAKSFSMTPARDWNLAVNGKVQIWTIEGPILQRMQVFNGIEDGKPLVEALSADQDKKPPVFEASMTPIEIRDLFVATIARVSQLTLETGELRPEAVADEAGFRFEYNYTDKNGVDKRGFVLATTRNDRLYLFDYAAVALYYYERYINDAEQLVKSLSASAA
ncbi:MAG: hypothetical protein HOF34_01155 [Rhodospirillaceae bacterium]|nr:hypothetical protein [Rhodospirillaceae bacterium]